jgi:DNA ligase-1
MCLMSLIGLIGMLLAEKYTDDIDPTGWWLSEKLDGVRAWWSKGQLVTRNGTILRPPLWYTNTLPSHIVLDGELWQTR